MRPRVFFSAFEPLHEVPEACDICTLDPPIFSYEFHSRDENGKAREKKGFCCSMCAVTLVLKAEREASNLWAEEEAALKSDDFDVSDFQQHRLVAYAKQGR